MLLVAAMFSACSGGGGSAPATPVPTTNAMQFTPSSTAQTTVSLPPVGTYSGTILVPQASSVAQVTVQTSLAAPAGISALSTQRRAQAGTSSTTPFFYIMMSVASGTATFDAYPSFSITLPASAGNGPFYLASYESGTWVTVAGPASASGNAVTLQPPLSSLTIAPGAPLYLVVYSGGVVPSEPPIVTPSAQPTASATPTVTPTPVETPSTAPTASVAAPSSFVMGTWPSGQWGVAIAPSAIGGFTILDASGNPISGDLSQSVTVSSDDPSVTLCLIGNCVPATSIALTSGSQASQLAMSYSGAAVAAATISVSAPGATGNSVQFVPASAPIAYDGPATAQEIDLYEPLGGGMGSTFQFTATQAGYTGAYGNEITASVPTACNSFATVTPSAGTTFTVTATASPTPGACTIVLSGFGTSTTSVLLTYTEFGVTLK